MKTRSIINLSVYKNKYNKNVLDKMAETYTTNLGKQGFTNITSEKTTMGGYDAYTVTGLYKDGMYLTIWIFIDKNDQLHYISVEYMPSDKASYEMVRDTYRLD